MPLSNRVTEVALAHGFKLAHANGMAYEHTDGHVLATVDCSYVIKFADGTLEECNAQNFASYYQLSPENFGALHLEESLVKRGIGERVTDRQHCREKVCFCHDDSTLWTLPHRCGHCGCNYSIKRVINRRERIRLLRKAYRGEKQ